MSESGFEPRDIVWQSGVVTNRVILQLATESDDIILEISRQRHNSNVGVLFSCQNIIFVESF